MVDYVVLEAEQTSLTRGKIKAGRPGGIVKTKVWLRTDTVDNAIDCVEMANHVLATVNSDMKWKWVIIAVHQALYGFAIECTWRDVSSSVLRKPEDPESHVISIWDALGRTEDQKWMTRHGSMPLVMTSAERDSVRRLCEHYRNEFEHFGVKSWSIALPGLPKLIEGAVSVIRKLAIDCNAVTYELVQQEKRVANALDRLGRQLAAADTAYGEHNTNTTCATWQSEGVTLHESFDMSTLEGTVRAAAAVAKALSPVDR